MKLPHTSSLALLLLVLGAPLSGRDYFVAADGSNAHPGTIAQPLATIGRALALAQSGDAIFLARGHLFREGDLSTPLILHFGAYGDPQLPPPVWTGSDPVSGWQPWATDQRIFVTGLSQGSALQLYDRGALATLARTPDTGWLRVDDGSGNNTIKDSELTTLAGNRSGRWKGAQVRWRKWSWWYETRPISADNGSGQLTLGGTTFQGKTGIGSGYFIDNSLAALDAPGEWYWDAAFRKLYYFPVDGVAPGPAQVEATWRVQGITLAGGSIRGIEFRHFAGQAVVLNGPTLVEDCRFSYCWDAAIRGEWDAGGSQIRANHIHDMFNLGISWRENDTTGSGGTVIEDNLLERCGTFPGLGGSGSWHGCGAVIYRATGLLFRRNRIEWTGYAGIILGSEGHTVEKNVFRYCMYTLNDGAAIYTNCHRSTIRDNIILDTVCDLESSHPWHPLAHGIWPEFLSSFEGNIITGNTVYGSAGNGLWLPNNFDAVVADNIFLSNQIGGLDIGGAEPGRSDGRPQQNHSLRDNLFGIGALPHTPLKPQNLHPDEILGDYCLTYHTYTDRDLDYGSMTGTTFLTPHGLRLIGPSEGPWAGTLPESKRRSLSIAEWQQQETAWADPLPSVFQGFGYLFINDTDEEATLALPTSTTWRDLRHLPLTSLSLPPYRSAVVLADAGVQPHLAPYFLATEYALWDSLSYRLWSQARALSDPLDTPGSDPDGDGIVNLAEYFFGLDPLQNNAQSPLRLYSTPEGWRLHIERQSPLESLTVVLESTSDLQHWTDRETINLEEGWIAIPGTDRSYRALSLEAPVTDLTAWRLRISLPE